MRDQSERLEYFHNKGQEDYPDWDPPFPGVPGPLLGEEDAACRDAYKVGWRNAKEQAGGNETDDEDDD